tara:strand:+ start:7844 stop:8845 length:1002 start_codon:yes stop_codon:yes gene_type:complete
MPINLRDALPLKVPLRVWIDPTNVCNFKCTFCPTGDDELLKSVNRPKGFMTLETFKNAINGLEEIVKKYNFKPIQISLYKDGEPLLNKDLPKMIKMLRDKNITDCVEITSNASALTEKNSREILNAGLQRIRFSVEHVSDEGYQKITQKKIPFKKIYENIKRFSEMNQSMGKPCFINTKIVNVNYPEEDINKFKKLFTPLADTAEIDYLHGWSDTEKKDFRLGSRENKSMGGDPLINRKVCPEPFSRLTIYFNGDASPCCVDWAHKLVVGNVNDMKMDEIWNGNRANEIRLYHLKHNIPKDSPCYSCQYMFGHPEYDSVDGQENRLLKEYKTI